jgi:hypothetical protein
MFGGAAMSMLVFTAASVGVAGAMVGRTATDHGQDASVGAPATTMAVPMDTAEALVRLKRVFAADVAALLTPGMSPVAGSYFADSPVAPYTFVIMDRIAGVNQPTPGADRPIATQPVYVGRVWLRDSAGTGDVTVTMSLKLAGTPTTCDKGGSTPCQVQVGPHGEIMVAIEISGSNQLYVTRTDGTQLALSSSSGVHLSKLDTPTDARPQPPLDLSQLIQLATDPRLSLYR